MKMDIDTPYDTEIKQRICENTVCESAYNESRMYLCALVNGSR